MNGKLRLFLALFLSLSLTTPAAAFWPFSDPEPPVQGDVTVSAVAGEPYRFSAADFSLDGTLPGGYRIGALPDAGRGVLQIGAMLVLEGDRVDRAALDGLTWYPLEKRTGEISFQITPLDGELEGAPATVTIHYLDRENCLPQGRDQAFSTFRESPVTGTLLASDPEGQPLTYRILTQPQRGTLTLEDPSAGTFTYLPDKPGAFSFTWLAQDPYGGRSEPNTVTITVDREEAEVTYADLAGSPLSYAASRLAQEGIYVGGQIGGASYFGAETPLTRCEFLVLALRAAGIPPETADLATGCSDDGNIPGWARPYGAAAWKLGLVREKALRPMELVTPAEAARMLDRLLALPDAVAEVFAPASAGEQAGQEIANACAAGLMTQGMALEAQVTRGDAARMLCRVWELSQGA